MRAHPTKPFLPIILSLFACSCDQAIDDRVAAESTRELRDAIDRVPRLDATSESRFPMRGTQVTSGPLRWEVPATWASVSGSNMRIADFRFGERGEGECYLSHLPGAAGGIEANVNRWRNQLGLEPIDEVAIAALPTIPVLGGPATYVDLSGTYTGMRDPTPKPDYRVLGAILSLGEMSLFVKMVGPESLVEAERGRFESFCKSIQFNREAAPAS